ncbi:MAG: type II toxin-antitoxin system prevent-host-death family antitoxin [Candidatus Omnitrophica bacterium]|nr:type II toxin-antitoxin system prevent-host-death family antitoxin [Candidatus Omnitrophota bacterium]
MQTIGIFDAKTHFSAIMEQVIQGQEVLITRRGQLIAKISPVNTQDKGSIAQTIDAILKFRKKRKSSQAQSRAWIQQGRRL